MKRIDPFESPEAASVSNRSLRDLAILFIRLGATAFGGPAAHIAMMEDEVVRRRGWLDRATFLDFLGATNLIPGPNSTEMAIHIGHRRAGWKGLVVAGVCFIVPAMLITLAVSYLYVRFGAMPSAQGILYGVKPVIIAVVVQALWRLGRAAVRDRFLVVLAIVSTIVSAVGVNELVVLFAAGAIAAASVYIRERHAGAFGAVATRGSLLFAIGATSSAAVPFSLSVLFLFFLKVGAVLFGSGYVLLAFLQADLVDRLHWLTPSQLLDAIAVGQITPGPVFCTATFIGYLLGGAVGALVATAGIFLPAFVFVAMSAAIIPRLRRSRIAGGFLDGVNVGSLALMAVVTWELGRSALVDVPTIVLGVASAAALLTFGINSIWLVIAGALLGLVLAH
ncbi:MAG TPA: chromate efflux transporter [Candidatus Binataceae bacterium]|nr:chromate efflux transporter [Candidatus Binataceae bacterium]